MDAETTHTIGRCRGKLIAKEIVLHIREALGLEVPKARNLALESFAH